ncbi:MAG TPA: EAL domain-containing response regulator [Polyangiales bacterium]|nr:EAL domain-containing response regulator [Polyangiales bacterium]
MGTQTTVQSVLILEDHDFQRSLASALLKDCGVSHIVGACDGEESLSILREQSIQVVLCDLQTPGMDGVSLLRHIAQEGLADAVIIASAMDIALICTVEEMARSCGLQVLGAVEKPLTRQKLSEMLARFRPRAAQSEPRALEMMGIDDIRTGLARDEMLPYFQPKVSLSTRRCTGVEALVRWKHPQRGLIPPLAFIPVAEGTPAIHDLTWMMAHKAITAMRSWERTAWPLSLSLNFSADVLCTNGVVERMTDAATRYAIEPANLVLEVTESVIGRDTTQLLETLARLRLRGFGLSIDDFGTGYSSMQQLSRISFTELKIDRSFVRGAASRSHLRTILEGSLTLARNLRLKSVAEGVETQEDWDLLRDLGCDEAQGYFIAKPMPSDAFLDWHASWTRG